MSTTNYLGILLMTASQNSKYLTVNDMVNALAGALASPFTQAMSDANQTLASSDAYGNLFFNCTGADTADRNLIVPSGAGSNKLYIVKNSTTGGHNIVVKTSGGTGITVGASDGMVLLYCDGTNVVGVAQASAGGANPIDVGVFWPGVGANSQKLLRIPVNRAITFPAGAASSNAKAGTAATASTTFTLTKNGTSFATVVFGISSATGTWTQASDANFSAGDVLEIDGPATADATLADFGINLAGTR